MVALALAPAAVHAEPAPESSRFVEGGMAFGAAEPVIGWNLMATVAAGIQIAGPWWAHAAFAYGPTIDNLGGHGLNNGRNLAVHAGAEGRWCSSRGGALCGIAGLDLGGQHGSWAPNNGYLMSASSTALVAIPRVGVDVGTTRIRARVDLEADAALVSRHHEVYDPMYPTTRSPSGILGIELAAGVWLAW